jgi:hypothetical protein
MRTSFHRPLPSAARPGPTAPPSTLILKADQARAIAYTAGQPLRAASDAVCAMARHNIARAASFQQYECVFTVPGLLPDHGLYDYGAMCELLERRLRQEGGYFVKATRPGRLYIHWRSPSDCVKAVRATVLARAAAARQARAHRQMQGARWAHRAHAMHPTGRRHSSRRARRAPPTAAVAAAVAAAAVLRRTRTPQDAGRLMMFGTPAQRSAVALSSY